MERHIFAKSPCCLTARFNQHLKSFLTSGLRGRKASKNMTIIWISIRAILTEQLYPDINLNMLNDTFTAFQGSRRILRGPLLAIATEIGRMPVTDGPNILIFSDASGKAVDIDTRGTDQDIFNRFGPKNPDTKPSEEPRGRGRPKLGVIAREVTLLPRHWEWLNAQPGGASVSLRKLVDEARAKHVPADLIRQSREAAYHFMSAIAGDFPGFEEATRALFAGDRERFTSLTESWPADIRYHATELGFAASTTTPTTEKE